MNHTKTSIKRWLLYFIGLFTLSLGISFSIAANLGVTPVSSLAYSLALITGISVGVMTFLSHTLSIVAQAILQKTMNLKDSIMQINGGFFIWFLDRFDIIPCKMIA